MSAPREESILSPARHLDKLSILLFFAFWQLLPKLGGIVETFIAPPTVVARTLVQMFREDELIHHVAVSLFRSTSGFATAAAVAIPLGFLLGGSFRTFERLVNPVLRFLGQVNPFSLFPLFILIFGIGELSKGAMIFWVCLWPILFNTINGVKTIDPLLIRSARSMGTGVVTLFFKVILPAASPGIFHGLKMGCGTAFFMLIASEMIGASAGLGWLVWNAQINFQMPQLFAATVLISALGLSLNLSFAALESRLVGWKQKSANDNV
ncbi:MAG TPA: ABC transporter permease [Geobacteraceae bacterium]